MVAESSFNRIDALKDATLADLAQWPEPRLHRKPAAAEWSALEVLDHLARTDASIVAQMRKNAAAPLPLTLVNRAAGKAFNVMFRAPIRVKTPAAASAILPTAPPDYASAASAWNAAVGQLRAFLESLDSAPQGAVFTHPGAGPMALGTALEFLETHTRHHLHQLERLRKLA